MLLAVGVGMRPATIAGKPIKLLTKTDQRNKLNEIKRNVAAQRAKNAAESQYMREVLGDSVEAAARAKAVPSMKMLKHKQKNLVTN